LRPGVSIVHPARDDGAISDGLVQSLVGVGIEQFIVPDHLAGSFARRLLSFDCQFGFVSSHSEMRGEWQPARLPTAIFIDGVNRIESFMEKIVDWTTADAKQCLVLVVPPGATVRGKPIVNVLSSSAPIGEAALQKVCRGG
jgi:ATP-dependent DNA helicase RecQ